MLLVSHVRVTMMPKNEKPMFKGQMTRLRIAAHGTDCRKELRADVIL